ncbi:MAG: substrate-binding domain-containing protein [Planctomycetaceae bacterium]|jgi:ABC-type molybdate transport system substrate-binding protein|nr:substrate-binding domain-containing protein [Planctomycetaceae bacterium]
MSSCFLSANRGILFLFCFVLCSAGCKKQEPVVLRLYCSDVFREVIKEETRVFQKVYGIQVEMLPVRPPKIKEEDKQEESAAAPRRRAPALWHSRPDAGAAEPSKTSNAVAEIAPEIEGVIQSIPQQGFADMYLSDSVPEMERVRTMMLTTREYPVCLIQLGLLVPLGNPQNIASLQDVIEKKLQLGTMDASKDGMGAAAQRVIALIPAAVAAAEEIHSRVHSFEEHDDLLAALEGRQIDAAVVWSTINVRTFLVKKYYEEYRQRFNAPIANALKRDNVEEFRAEGLVLYSTLLREKQFSEFIPFQDEERYVLNIPLLSLSTALHDGQTRRFADFLISPIGQDIFRKHGFWNNP